MPCRILVVEDSATQAEALFALLEGNGYDVKLANSGEAALERVRTEEFEMVLSDVVMPGITGYELCRRLKRDAQLRHLPVVLLTSLIDPMDIVRGLECGADNYITKPYDPLHLLDRLRNVRDNRRLRRNSKSSLGVTVRFLGNDLAINSEKEQILDLFISSVEDVVRTNEALHRSQEKLAEAQLQLEAFAKEKAREARLSTERYRALMQNAGDAIFVLDLHGRILEANRGAADLLRCSETDLRNRSLESLLAPGGGHEFRVRFDRLASDGQVHLGEHRLGAGDTDEVWCDLTGSSTPLEGETLVLVIARDITQRKRAEEELHGTNQRLTTLIEASPLAILDLDTHGRVRLWNSAAERIFGWREEEVLGERLPVVPAERAEEHRALCDRVLEGEAFAEVETYRTRKDGSRVEVSISAAPIRSPSGKIVGTMGVVADITERRQMEAARMERAEAERANRAKSEFLSRMSHELRTPMNAILGFAQLLNLDALNEEQQESVDQILTAGHHLLALIDEVLDLARIEAGKLSLALEPVAVDRVVRDAVGLIRPLAAHRAISLETVPERIPPLFVRADPQRLKQVLLNFLSNGVKYNRPSGSLSLLVEGTGEDWLRIGVRDTGAGISAQAMERLFVPFERLDAEASGTQGTGLGLVLARSLAEAMGGRVGVESVVGEGSTFWVELPRTESPSHVSSRSGAEVTAVSPSHAASATELVLYIEDNPSNLRLVERMLRSRSGIRLLAATQGSVGLELALAHHPDLILVDLNLPDLSGREVLRRLQESPALREIPVVVVSADARPDRIEELRRAGAKDYLVKPFDMRRFLDIIDSYLGASVQHAQQFS